MKLKDIYFDSFANWISGGNLINREAMSSLGIRALYGRIATKKYVRKVFCVYNIPLEYEYNLTHVINAAVFDSSPKSKVIVHTYNLPTDIPIYSDLFRRRLGLAEQDFETYRDAFDSLKKSEKLIGKTIRNPATGRKFYIRAEDLERIKIKYLSYNYIFSHIKAGGTFTESFYFIDILSPNKKELGLARKAVIEKLRGDNIYFNELTNNTSSYLRNFGPSSYLQDGNHRLPSILFSDYNNASIMPYMTNGLVGGTGLLVGVDQGNKLPLIIPFLGGTSAQVCIVSAKSGQGKTLSAFQIAMSALAENHHVSAIDIKGDEWVKLGKFSDHLVVSLDDRHPKFINTLRLDDLKLDRETAPEFLRIATNGTKTLMKLMVDPDGTGENSVDIDSLLSTIIQKYYATLGVDENNHKTFKYTKNAKYFGLLEIASTLESSSSYEPQLKTLLKTIRNRCSPYFAPEGVYNSIFREEVTLAEVLNTPLIIYSLNKNKNAAVDTLDVIKFFMIQFLDTKKQYQRKLEGKSTLSFYEELQRKDQFLPLLQFISHQVSGARSSNVSVFLLMNSLSIFTDPRTDVIRSNITSYILGKLNKIDIEYLEKLFSCPDIIPMVKAISTSDDSFENHFAIHYNTGRESDKAMFKVLLPADILESLSTRDVVV